MKQQTIWDSIGQTQTIFKEKEAFTIEFVPKLVKHRKNQIDKILYNLKDNLEQHKLHYNMILSGNYRTV